MTTKSSLTMSHLVLGIIALRLAMIVLAGIILRVLPEHGPDRSATTVVVSQDDVGHRDDLRPRD